eukprot:TRINITY_DN40084_c0_g2_i1.p1 TRINITY_DN40084_c0_g2~~TRINITY_DN40084_c0_g2_i1.p1  ORF type:complete len:392 (-),score=54.29 TRINITY_DN40084_c0_g2_i1:35-1210(-)
MASITGVGARRSGVGASRVDPASLPPAGFRGRYVPKKAAGGVVNGTSVQVADHGKGGSQIIPRRGDHDRTQGDGPASAGKGGKTGKGANEGKDVSGGRGQPSLQLRADRATQLFGVYESRYAPPRWSLSLLTDGKLEEFAKSVVVYYLPEDRLEDVKLMTFQREPVNIAMERHYDANALNSLAGYRTGAYGRSTKEQLMPNIAIYCRTPVVVGRMHVVCHVINVTGYAFDMPEQKDYKYFFDDTGSISDQKWKELVLCMQRMWQYIFECASQKRLSTVCVPDVGGGAFSALLGQERRRDYASLKEASFPPVRQRYSHIKVEALGQIPGSLFSKPVESLNESLLVNAWDPWSMVGNGNAGDNSLDGYFGRCTAMALLCWPPLNPYIEWMPVS